MILALVQATFLAQAAGAPASLPPLLARYLGTHPPYRLLLVSDLARERDYIESHHLFSPLAIADLNGDGTDDVLAVLVRRDGSKTLYAVAAFHAIQGVDTPRPEWVLKETSEPVLGVTTSAARRVDVWKCYQCGSNPFYRWNGVEYQPNLRAKGESVPVYHGASGNVEVRQEASPSGKMVVTLPPCTRVQILSVFPRQGRVRFYEVSTLLGGKKVTGFVSSDEVDEMPCMGQ
jgi:hypothetical protein